MYRLSYVCGLEVAGACFIEMRYMQSMVILVNVTVTAVSSHFCNIFSNFKNCLIKTSPTKGRRHLWTAIQGLSADCVLGHSVNAEDTILVGSPKAPPMVLCRVLRLTTRLKELIPFTLSCVSWK